MLSYEDAAIHILRDLESQVIFKAGSKLSELNIKPRQSLSQEVIEFLSSFSTYLLRENPSTKYHSDLASYAFWIRNASLKRLMNETKADARNVGRGLALHITPTNMPMNFAYSWTYALLSGCPSIVRVTSRNYEQANIFLKALDYFCYDRGWREIQEQSSFIEYDKASINITQSISKICFVRLIWGGDQTIRTIKSIESSSRCCDITFPSRYSCALINANHVCRIGDDDLSKIVNNFYNDAFIMDQNACSSPHIVIWHGNPKGTTKASERIWGQLEKTLILKLYNPKSGYNK